MKWTVAFGVTLVAAAAFGVGLELGAAKARSAAAPSDAPTGPSTPARAALLKQNAGLQSQLAARNERIEELEWWIDHTGGVPDFCALRDFRYNAGMAALRDLLRQRARLEATSAGAGR